MKTETLTGIAALTAGLLIALPAAAGGNYTYGGMPGYGGQGYGPMPYGYGLPMYGPGYNMPFNMPFGMSAYPPMRGYGPRYAPRYAPGYRMHNQAMPYSQRSAPSQQPAATAANTGDGGTSAEKPAADTAEVSIRQMQFVPARIVVKKGGKVTWTQQDSMPHNVTASNGSFGSDTLSNGGTFSKTFDKAGTYNYYCGLHPSMRGEVVVVD